MIPAAERNANRLKTAQAKPFPNRTPGAGTLTQKKLGVARAGLSAVQSAARSSSPGLQSKPVADPNLRLEF
jgi:hypothetical protein